MGNTKSTHQLSHCVATGDFAGAKQALEARPELAATRRRDQDTLLHIAAGRGNADALDELLAALYRSQQSKPARAASRAEAKVVNHANQWGQRALHLACRAGSVRCVRLLLGAGADPVLLDFEGLSCLHYAAKHGRTEVIKALLGDTTWVIAVQGRALLRDAFVMDARGLHKYIDGRTGQDLSPLHLAVAHGRLGAARALINRGAALTPRCALWSQGGWPPHSTPLHIAAALGDHQAVLLLLTAWAQRVQRAQRQGAAEGQPPQEDPRALHNFVGRRPVDVAAVAGYSHLLPVLNPSTPLDQVVDLPPTAAPRLAALAAGALRARLSAQLQGLAAQPPAATAEAADGGAAPAESACCPICLEGGSAACSGKEAQGKEQLQQHGRWQRVAAGGCQHVLCLPCAQQLCRESGGSEGAPVRCPLCRDIVGSWVPA